MSSRLPYAPQEALARALRALREEKEISQKEFAKRIGISPSWLSKIESGHYDPPWSSVRRVVNGLSISFADLEEVIDSYESSVADSDAHH